MSLGHDVNDLKHALCHMLIVEAHMCKICKKKSVYFCKLGAMLLCKKTVNVFSHFSSIKELVKYAVRIFTHISQERLLLTHLTENGSSEITFKSLSLREYENMFSTSKLGFI